MTTPDPEAPVLAAAGPLLSSIPASATTAPDAGEASEILSKEVADLDFGCCRNRGGTLPGLYRVPTGVVEVIENVSKGNWVEITVIVKTSASGANHKISIG